LIVKIKQQQQQQQQQQPVLRVLLILHNKCSCIQIPKLKLNK